ncbi:hypothetical protein V2G26_017996 [Clonostachys chloroleuca]
MSVAHCLVHASYLLLHFDLVNADSPIVQHLYTADTAPIVHGDRVYLMAGHDEDGSTNYDTRDWQLFSSSDMANWQNHGSPVSLETFPWAVQDAWAAQLVERDGKFYFYAPVVGSGDYGGSIGVAVAENITGPYVDAIGSPLIPQSEIDPTAFIDDDGQAYSTGETPTYSTLR